MHSELLNSPDVFLDFDETQFPDDVQGWGSDHPFMRSILDLVRPKTVIEVGVWKGAATIHMLQVMHELGIEPKFYCVDTWTGSIEHWTEEPYQPLLGLKHGFPTLYWQFLANVKRSGFHSCVTPVPMPSRQAALLLASANVLADFIYIDAAHDEQSVRMDAEEYWSLLTGEGAIMFDDYGTWPGVTTAVNAFAAEKSVPVYATAGKAVLLKDRERWLNLDIQPSL